MIYLIIHIVRENERIGDILKNYNIELDDLKANNLHITDFNHLIYLDPRAFQIPLGDKYIHTLLKIKKVINSMCFSLLL